MKIICADFLAGVNVREDDFLEELIQEFCKQRPRLKLNVEEYRLLHYRVLERDRWRCQDCDSLKDLQVHLEKAKQVGERCVEQPHDSVLMLSQAATWGLIPGLSNLQLGRA